MSVFMCVLLVITFITIQLLSEDEIQEVIEQMNEQADRDKCSKLLIIVLWSLGG